MDGLPGAWMTPAGVAFAETAFHLKSARSLALPSSGFHIWKPKHSSPILLTCCPRVPLPPLVSVLLLPSSLS